MTAGDDEPFLQRWLRRKADAAAGRPLEDEPPRPEDAEQPVEGPNASGDAAAAATGAPAQETPPDESPAAGAPDDERPITDADLPDLSELDQDSDYSMFMAAGVSPEKRQAALRQLFRSPKFNVTDGLDDYCEDFTKFDPLGSIVTAEMRHHAERLARKALEAVSEDEEGPALAAGGEPEAPAAPPATDAAVDADDDHPATDEPGSDKRDA